MEDKEFLAIRFKSRYGNNRYVVIPRNTVRDIYGKLETVPGKAVITSHNGETAPIQDVDCLRFFCRHEWVGEVVAIWPGKGMVREHGTEMTEWEKNEMEKLIRRIDTANGKQETEPIPVAPQPVPPPPRRGRPAVRIPGWRPPEASE